MILRVIKQNGLLFSLSLSLWEIGIYLAEPWTASQEVKFRTINYEQISLTEAVADFGIILGKTTCSISYYRWKTC